jgi:hypothetical protein
MGLRAACASLLVACLGSTYAATETLDLEQVYPELTLEGCFAKDDADVIAALARRDGSGSEAWVGFGMSNRCVVTHGSTRIMQVYSSHNDRSYGDDTVWYVRYELYHQDSWHTFYGFTSDTPRCDACI